MAGLCVGPIDRKLMMSPILNRRSVLGLGGLAMVCGGPTMALARPAQWAVPIALDGAPNLHRVTPQLFRSAQPDAVGFANLADLGIKTVINLRQLVDDTPLAQGTGLILRRVKMKSRDVGEAEGAKMVQVLRDLRQGLETGPVLVHCHHGADRTGAVMALHRILFQGWTRAEALDELINGGFGFHAVWANIPRFVAKCDLADIKRRVMA